MLPTKFNIALCLLLFPVMTQAQDALTTSCGINSALALSQALGHTNDARVTLESAYPNATASLLDVKKMCAQQNIQTEGIKATIAELLRDRTPCIIGLKRPEHFTLLLDGGAEQVRLIDGDDAALKVVPRRDIEARFSGYALVHDSLASVDVPQLTMPRFDQYMVFEGIGQKADFRFPLKNSGNTPLSVEVSGTSCGCTAAVLQGKDPKNLLLAPGASGEVVVSYQVQTQAPMQQSATLKTNDPRRPFVYLTIRGQIPPQLTLSPPALYVDQNPGEEPDKMFKVIGPKGTRIEKVWSDLPYLQLQQGADEVDGERVKWPVSVQGFAKAPVGPINGKINIRLVNGQEMFVQVRGLIEGGLPGAAEAALLPRAEDDHQAPMGSPLPLLKVGQAAPDFQMTDAHGNPWHLSAIRGRKNVLLTFFPKCFTGGCATQLSSLRDHQKEFDATQTQIMAVSVDPAEGEQGQLAFAKQWGFQFPLIPDPKRQLGKQFGAVQNDDERAARLSFLIDKSGIVRWIDTDVHVGTHGADVLAKIHELGLDGVQPEH